MTIIYSDFLQIKHFSSFITLKDCKSIINYIITVIIKNIKVKVNFKKTRLKKFNEKIKVKVKLTRNTILITRKRLIQACFNNKLC